MSNRARRGLTRLVDRALRVDRLIAIGIAVTVLALLWFAGGPSGAQLFGIRLVTPVLASLVAIGQWRLAGQPHTPPAPARFWRILSVAMALFTTGMVIDLVSLFVPTLPEGLLAAAGETLLYPVAALFSVAALVVFPTTAGNTVQRVKIALDVVIVLLGSATFVSYFLAIPRWQPADGWHKLSGGLVLPALTLVAGFAVLRVMMAGANLISRPTIRWFITGACIEVVAMFIELPAATPWGRLGSTLQTLGLTACVVGVAVQRLPWAAPADPPGWRRPFTILPYAALAATVVLLLRVVGGGLDARRWVVAAGVLALCVAVIGRQLVSLWENTSLLAANRALTGRLRYQAYHDQLTGLVNRSLFVDRVTEALAGTGEDGATVAVLFVDLDDFKTVNDSLGHQIGDALLIAVAGRLECAVGTQGILGRLGGDEFAILLPDTGGCPPAAVAERVIAALDDPFHLAGVQVTIAASVGFATASTFRESNELLRDADIAMYAAKFSRKGGWREFEPAMLTAVIQRHELRAALARAAERDEFDVHYQPIVDLASGAVVGAEALVRWRRPDGRLVEPAQFIPLAEETGLVAEIDRRVLLQACRQAVRWRTELPAADRFALHVNVSARHLHRPELLADVAGALRTTGLPANLLTIEVTESGLGQEHEAAIERLNWLSRLGVRVAIDDFGTGYSSLAYLQRMPVDVIKIDKVFVDELLRDEVGTTLVQAIIALASTLGIQTVAEGIEQPVQVRRLRDLGCGRGQGFHLGRPVAAAAMGELLARSATGGYPVPLRDPATRP